MSQSAFDGLNLLGILALTSPYWGSATLKLLDFAATRREVSALGLPISGLTAALVITAQFLASLLLIFGVWVWAAAATLIGFTLAASLLAHRFWRFDGKDRTAHLNAFLANLGLVGGLILAGLLSASP